MVIIQLLVQVQVAFIVVAAVIPLIMRAVVIKQFLLPLQKHAVTITGSIIHITAAQIICQVAATHH